MLITNIKTNQQVSLETNQQVSLGKHDYTLRKKYINSLKPIQSDYKEIINQQFNYKHTMTVNSMWGVPQVWFW
jgi:hypothetical protein